MTALSSDDAWAVATFPDSRRPRTLHWGGRVWTEVFDPAPGGAVLTSVDAIATDDVWAVGMGSKLFAEHWDGSAWARMGLPNPGIYVAALYGVSGSSPNDVWSVGYFTSDRTHTLAEHWDGKIWRVVDTPSEVPGLFIAVEAISADDAWAVGYQDQTFGNFQPLIEHWDGSAWTVIAPPPLDGNDNTLYGISASSSTDVWAVGAYRPDDTIDWPLTFHWDGTAWSQVYAPPGGDAESILEDVAVIAPDDAWAVGSQSSEPLSLHWDGTAWTVRPAPAPGGEPATFHSVAASASNDIWAVGYSSSLRNGYVIEHSRGACP